jgi:hypothetical protein
MLLAQWPGLYPFLAHFWRISIWLQILPRTPFSDLLEFATAKVHKHYQETSLVSTDMIHVFEAEGISETEAIACSILLM